ncbi:MAG: alpha-ribazole phosphatase family protein [Gammaproteobacteria bacterium]|jgi:alpha-ribazole phosphatase|nr:alpha-ribazole phosphatase family protein [Gammaproteobacteria bacterium]
MAIIDLIRHGEPEGGRRYRGATDDPLTAEGWRQMEAAVAGASPWQRIYTSPLRRCSEFARALGARMEVPVHEDARLQELGYGAWEGLTPEEIRRQDPGQLARFFNDPLAHQPAGAEPLADFQRRVLAGWRDILQACANEQVLLVAHAGTLRAVLGQVLGMPLQNMFRINIGYAARIRIRSEGDRPPALVIEGID